ncbi:MAG TPA: TlpA disulfide reductase family protein [Dokdonella sp.]|jgi:thiol-disulfide isomerase/thioredoxin|nr:TlpA disulfide reductase family protein [Dokdonella sp.]
MFNRTNLLIIVLAIASAGIGLGLSAMLRPSPPAPARMLSEPQTGVLAIGDATGEVRLPDREGKPRSLAEWSGKLVVMNFWASWCGPCREEMPMLDRAHQRYAARGVAVIGVASEEAPAALGFLESHPVSYPILINSPAEGIDFSLRFGNTQSVLPFTALVGRDGRILATRMGSFSEKALDDWIAPYL